MLTSQYSDLIKEATVEVIDIYFKLCLKSKFYSCLGNMTWIWVIVYILLFAITSINLSKNNENCDTIVMKIF